MRLILKKPLSIEQQVLCTLIRNGIFRADCVYILCCGKDCVDTHLDNARKDNHYECLEEFLCDCAQSGLVKKMNAEEKQKYQQLAEHNRKHRIKRPPGEAICWEEIYKDLYPDNILQ